MLVHVKGEEDTRGGEGNGSEENLGCEGGLACKASQLGVDARYGEVTDKALRVAHLRGTDHFGWIGGRLQHRYGQDYACLYIASYKEYRDKLNSA